MATTKTSGRTYTEIVAARFTPKQAKALTRAAKKAGLDRGTYVRLVLLAACGASPIGDDIARATKAGAS